MIHRRQAKSTSVSPLRLPKRGLAAALCVTLLGLSGCSTWGARTAADANLPEDSGMPPPAASPTEAQSGSHSIFPFSLFSSSESEDEGKAAAQQTSSDDETAGESDAESSPSDAESIAERRDPVRQELYSQLREWRSVRYRIGGMSKRGVDCSGFVYLTYRDKFGIELPRDTSYQIRAGHEVSRAKLKPGDLVFFRMGKNRRHVGIYLDNHHFMHASSSFGVTVSNLDDSYWTRHYWKSIRIGS